MNYIIEIATSDFTTTASAIEGGADRIELCASLTEGGTTASYATIIKCRENFPFVELFPIIRPRGGDFLYTKHEFDVMLYDIKLCREVGCNGVVIGLLNMDGTIDMIRTEQLVNSAYPLEITFHRAFDRCIDPFEAMEQLIEIGCQRILTSGQQKTAPEGIDLIRELNERAEGRITIMPGSGVRKENIKMLAENTGCKEFHSSLRGSRPSGMNFRHPVFKDAADSYMNNSINAEEVTALRNALS
jgi:copper homeostasis protein